jgi:hypothetical protein
MPDDALTGELLLSSLANERVPEVRGAVVRSIAQRGPDDNASPRYRRKRPEEQNASSGG